MSEDNSTVQYRDITGFPGYRVGDDGSVWSRWRTCRWGTLLTDKWHRLKASVKKDRTAGRAYLYLNLVHNGKAQSCRVHRLILQSFIGPCPLGMESRHLDGNPANNRLDNLRWGTPEENRADNQRNDRHIKGERHPLVKLTEKQVLAIRARRTAGASLRELAAEFGVGVPTISSIANRRSWKHI